jgi:glutaredoxin
VPVIGLTLYTRPGCHLCDEMKAAIARAAQGVAFTLDEVDISGDPALEARYGVEIPVLMVDGKKVAKYRIADADLRRVLTGKAG